MEYCGVLDSRDLTLLLTVEWRLDCWMIPRATLEMLAQ